MFFDQTVKIFKKLYARLWNPRSAELSLEYEDLITLLAKNLRPAVYVELGIYECDVFNSVIPFVSKRLIGVDFSFEAGKFMKKSPKTEFYCMTSDEFFEKAKKENLIIDMIFIDADHSADSVLKDFNNFFSLVREDGIILLHDGYPRNEKFTEKGYCGDAYKAIFELSKESQNYEMVTIPLHPGLTICRKRTKQLPWLN